jgi:hypothetical protein
VTAALASASAISVAALFAARAAMARIERNPDPSPCELIAREPEGDEVLIHHPDGTVLRAGGRRRADGGPRPRVQRLTTAAMGAPPSARPV